MKVLRIYFFVVILVLLTSPVMLYGQSSFQENQSAAVLSKGSNTRALASLKTQSMTSTSGIHSSNTPTNLATTSQNKLTTSTIIWVPLISGGLAGAIISALLSIGQRRREYRSLILTFCAELVSVYERCVMYYQQAQEGSVSYSALFTFTDAGALSKLASVSKKPETVAAIIELKSMYFQIQRHVDEASRLAVDSSLESISNEKDALMKGALHARGRALAFFLGSYYSRITKETRRLLDAMKDAAPGQFADDLYSRFLDAEKRKDEIDQKIKDKKKADSQIL